MSILVLTGLPGSGKSTYAQSWLRGTNGHRVNWDELRVKMYGPNWKFNRHQEEAMKLNSFLGAEAALIRGEHVIVDNTNLTPGVRNKWKALATKLRVPYEEQDFDTPVAECVRRDRQRVGHQRVGRAVIERMALFHGYIDWSDRNLYPRNFVIVDMDGTVANCDERRRKAFLGPTIHKTRPMGAGQGQIPVTCSLQDVITDRQCPECNGKAKKNWGIFYDGCENDPVIQPIVDLVVGYFNNDYDILVVSGRPIDPAGKPTEEWLERNMPVAKHLFMRAGGDSRHDYIVKEEILELLPKERIAYVLDDRDQVVEMWRRNGLTCLQVADGKF